MDNKTTVKIWVTPTNFDLIQEGSYPTEFKTTQPSNLNEYVELVVNMQTLTEWVSKHRSGSKPNKNILLG